MRIRNKAIVGRIGDDGELIANWPVMAEFLAMHKGKAVILRAELQPKEASEKTKNYFFGYIVPEMRNAYLENGEHLTKSETYDRIRNACPLFIKEERVNGEWRRRLMEWEELDQCECNEVIDFIVQYAAENFYKILDLPQ